MSNELAVIEIQEKDYPVIFGNTGLDVFVEKVKAEVSGEVPDLTTAKGRARIASLAAAVSRSKTAVEKPGREYLKQLKDMPKKIEAELREFTQKMDALRDETRKPLTDWENEERVRVAAIQSRVEHLASFRCDLNSWNASQIDFHICELEQIVIDQSFDEFEAEAHREKAKSLECLKVAHEQAVKREAEQAELSRLRAEAEERAKADRERRIAEEAAAKAKREAEEAAEREKQAAELKAKAEREAAEKRELELKLAAERAEREKLAAEAAQKAAEAAKVKAEHEAQAKAEQAARDAEERVKREAEAKAKAEADELARREADKQHKATINNAAARCFIDAGFSEEMAKVAVKLIAMGMIPNVKIMY